MLVTGVSRAGTRTSTWTISRHLTLEHRAIIIAGQANPPTKTREDIRRNRFAQLYGQQRPALVSGAALFASDGPYSDAAVFHIVLKQKTGPGAHEGDPPSLLRCTPSFL